MAQDFNLGVTHVNFDHLIKMGSAGLLTVKILFSSLYLINMQREGKLKLCKYPIPQETAYLFVYTWGQKKVKSQTQAELFRRMYLKLML